MPLPIGALMTGQLGAKLLLSTLMVPPLIWLAVRLGPENVPGEPAG